MIIRFIASTEADITSYQDHFLGLKTIFEEAQFPYWILVRDQSVLGLIVAAKEPRDLLQQPSTKFIQIYLFRHDPEAVEQLLVEAQRIATEHQAAYISCKVSSDKHESIQVLEKAEFTVYDEIIKMGVPLDNVVPPTTNLSFYRTSPEETSQILDNIASSMTNTPGRLLHTVVFNIRNLPPDQLESMLSQMEVVLVKDSTNTVGLLSLEGPNHWNARGSSKRSRKRLWSSHYPMGKKPPCRTRTLSGLASCLSCQCHCLSYF